MTHNIDSSIHRRKVKAVALDSSWRSTLPYLKSSKTHNQTESFYHCAFPKIHFPSENICSSEPNSSQSSLPRTKSTSNHRENPEASPEISPIPQESEKHLPETLHDRINLFLERLDEQQRRWFVALAAEQLGRGGIQQMSQITGMHPDTIRRGRKELERGLVDRPKNRARRPGGGRPSKS